MPVRSAQTLEYATTPRRTAHQAIEKLRRGGRDLVEDVDHLLAPAHEVAGRDLRAAQHRVEAAAHGPPVHGGDEALVEGAGRVDVVRLLEVVHLGPHARGRLERAGGRGAGRAGLRVTRDGQWLRRLYAENDLLLAECLRRGVWEDLDAPALAAVVSTCVYAGRREDHGEPDVPGGPHGKLARALEATTRVWSEVDDLEEAHDIDATGQLDEGLVTAVHRWAVGRSLDAVLRGSEIAAGDFVRWCKQVIDVLDQVATAAPTPAVRRTAHQAIEKLRRGVVAYSSV